MMCALDNVRCITVWVVPCAVCRYAAEPVCSTRVLAPRRKSTSRNLSSLVISGLDEVCFGEEQQLRFIVRRRGPEAARRAVLADDLQQPPFFVFQHDHLESEPHDRPQVLVVPRLADEAKDLRLVDRTHRKVRVSV